MKFGTVKNDKMFARFQKLKASKYINRIFDPIIFHSFIEDCDDSSKSVDWLLDCRCAFSFYFFNFLLINFVIEKEKEANIQSKIEMDNVQSILASIK